MNRPLPLLPALEKFGHIDYRPVPQSVVDQGVEKVKSFCNMRYETGKVLGKGSFGEASEVCKDRKCDGKWILKRILIPTRKSLDTKEQYAARVSKMQKEVEQEVYLMRRLKGTHLAPELQTAWRCGDKSFNLVMERFDRNMLEQGQLQFKNHGEVNKYEKVYGTDELFLLYTERQWTEMLRLAKELGKQGIIHGDGKPDNLLYRQKDDRVVYTDFGFSGDYKFANPKFGWSYAFGCPAWSVIPQQQPQYMINFNFWELLMYFLIFAVVFIQLPDGKLVVFDWLVVLKALTETFRPSCTQAAFLLQTSRAAQIRMELMDQSGFKAWNNVRRLPPSSYSAPASSIPPQPQPGKGIKTELPAKTQPATSVNNQKERTVDEFQNEMRTAVWMPWLQTYEQVMKQQQFDPNFDPPLNFLNTTGSTPLIGKLVNASMKLLPTPAPLVLYVTITKNQWDANSKELSGYGQGFVPEGRYFIPFYVRESGAIGDREDDVKDANGRIVILRVTVPANTYNMLYFRRAATKQPYFLRYNPGTGVRARYETTGTNLLVSLTLQGLSRPLPVNLVNVNFVTS